MKRLIAAIVASLSLHALTLWCLSLIPATSDISKNAIDNFVEFVDSENAKERPDIDKSKLIVGKHTVPNEMLRKDDPQDIRRFASDKKQTVLEEMRAAESGLTQNRSNSALNRDQLGAMIPEKFGVKKKIGEFASTSEDGIESNFEAKSREAEEDGNTTRSIPVPSMNRFGLQAGRSTFADGRPDVRIGEMTALNTDQFLYYSFYERMKNLIYQPWAKYVKAVLYTYARNNATTGDEVWATHLEIVLDRNGNFIRAMVHQGSGLQGLDLAPVHAFKETKQIPHPPEEMVEKDGNIHVQYVFEVYTDSRYARSK